MADVLSRIASSTPHTPETANVIGIFAAVVMAVYVFLHPSMTISDVSHSYADLILAVGGGNVAQAIQRYVQGDKSTPEPQVKPS